MPTKVSIVLDEDVKAELERLAESGMRSRIISATEMVDPELEERQPVTYLEDIYRLMTKYKVTLYDADYHALAIHAGGVSLTADAAYARKTSGAGHVGELKNWPLPRS